MQELISFNNFQEVLGSPSSSNQPFILFFGAVFYAPSQKGGQVYEIIEAMSEKYVNIKFYYVDAESQSEISNQYNVTMVPTFVAIQNGKLFGKKVEGANPSDILELVKSVPDHRLSSSITTSSNNNQHTPDIKARLNQLVNSSPVMLFMKGTPVEPKCGFSRQIVEILKSNQIPFSFFNILTDNLVREELKVFSEWPTYPQLYVNGEFVGGLDIVKELLASSVDGKTFMQSLGLDLTKYTQNATGVISKMPDTVFDMTNTTTGQSGAVTNNNSINDKLKKLVNQDTVMLFMKGSPEAAKCGFSRQIVEILTNEAVKFSTFDILTDEEVRSGLKVYSDWPTYPQLYCKG